MTLFPQKSSPILLMLALGACACVDVEKQIFRTTTTTSSKEPTPSTFKPGLAWPSGNVVRTDDLTARGTRWSDPISWENRKLPAYGDQVLITSNAQVVLDGETPFLESLQIQGQIIHQGTPSSIGAEQILVQGALSAGTRQNPTSATLRIILAGPERSQAELEANEAYRGLIVGPQGTLKLHGAIGPTWSDLSQDTAPGGRRLALADSVDWPKGAQVVVSASGFDARESEEAEVGEAGAQDLRMEEAWRYVHRGTVLVNQDKRMRLQAQAIRLDRLISIEGQAPASTPTLGGHVKVEGGATLEIQGVAFTGLGQEGVPKRAPLWLSNLGQPQADVRIERASFHHNHQHCVVLEQTSNVTLTQNVTYDTKGHCFWLDSSSQNNTLEGNVALLTSPTSSQPRPALFYANAPQNSWRDNVATGTVDGAGFWVDLPPDTTNPQPILSWQGNLSSTHSWASPQDPDSDTITGAGFMITGYNAFSSDTPAISANTAHHNEGAGFWVSGHSLLREVFVAFNRVGVISRGATPMTIDGGWLAGADTEQGAPALRRALEASSQGALTLVGPAGARIDLGSVILKGVTLSGFFGPTFDQKALVWQSPFSTTSSYSQNITTTLPLTSRVSMKSGQKLLNDLDGSLLGEPGALFSLKNKELLDLASCKAWVEDGPTFCPEGVLFADFRFQQGTIGFEIQGRRSTQTPDKFRAALKHQARYTVTEVAPSATLMIEGAPQQYVELRFPATTLNFFELRIGQPNLAKPIPANPTPSGGTRWWKEGEDTIVQLVVGEPIGVCVNAACGN